MAGGREFVGHLALAVVGIRIGIGFRTGTRVRADPVSAGAVDVDVGIIAPAVAVVLQDMPAGNIGVEPSLVPAWVVNHSCILGVKHTVRIPFVEPDGARAGGAHPERQVGIEIAAGNGLRRIGDIEAVRSITARGSYYLFISWAGGCGCQALRGCSISRLLTGFHQ